jgi:group II intron reverse transcriptase/maturase/CRISPR-associated endonuclease Cas2
MYVVAYDISDSRRRTRLRKKLVIYGRPVQLSVFEFVDERIDAALAVIEAEVLPVDSVRVYHICKRCAKTVKVLGSDSPQIIVQEQRKAVIEVPKPKQFIGKKNQRITLMKGPRERGELTSPSHLLDLICAMANLNEAFLDVRSNRGCAGSDGVSLAAFDKNRAENLAKLQGDLLAGIYRPAPLKVFDIPKSDGSQRILKVPSVRDRVAQQAVLRIISPIWERELEDSSYAYRPGRSVKQAVNRLKRYHSEGWGWVLRSDVEDFFDEIPHGEMIARFAEKISDEHLVALVSLWVASKALPYAAGNVKEAMGGGFLGGKGIPQGSVVSPLLSNIYLDRFDEEMILLGYKVVRYADDFTVACQSEQEAECALADTKRLLAQDGLRINIEKTQLTTFAKGFTFLGHYFIGSFALKKAKIPAGIKITSRHA